MKHRNYINKRQGILLGGKQNLTPEESMKYLKANHFTMGKSLDIAPPLS
jgi:hypothetical protein